MSIAFSRARSWRMEAFRIATRLPGWGREVREPAGTSSRSETTQAIVLDEKPLTLAIPQSCKRDAVVGCIGDHRNGTRAVQLPQTGRSSKSKIWPLTVGVFAPFEISSR